MASVTPTILRGVLVPDSRITSAKLWAAQSTYTEAGPIPGTAAAQQATEMALHTSGTQSSGTVYVKALSGGGVGGAGFGWKGSTDTYYRGWDPPAPCSSFRTIAYETGTSIDGARWPHAVATTGGKVVVAFTGAQGGTSRVETRTISAAQVVAADVTVASQTTSGTLEMRPALVVLPSGRIVCFYFSYASTSWVIASEYSDDDGATWTLLNSRATAGPGASATYVPNFLRAAYSEGQICLIAGYVDGGNANVRQWASIDLGATFTLVSTRTSASYEYLSGDVVGLPGGGFLAALWTYQGTNDFYVYSARIGGAFGSLSDQFATATGTTRKTIVSDTGTTRSYGSIALAPADDGRVYAVALWDCVDATTAARGETWATEDSGETWTAVGLTTTATAPWFRSENDGPFPKGLGAVWHRGRVLIYANAWQRVGLPTNGNSLYEWALGGYTTVTTPAITGTAAAAWQATLGHDATWYAIGDPTGFDYTAAGTPTATYPKFNASVQAWEVQTTSPNTYEYTDTTAGAVADGYMAECIMRADTGGASLTVQDGTGNYSSRVSISTGSPDRMFFTDVVAGATLSNPAITADTAYHVRIWQRGPKASAWYRLASAGPDAEWTLLAENQTLSAGALTGDEVRFGCPIAQTNVAYFWSVVHGGTAALAPDYSAGIVEADLRARPFATTPVYVDDGLGVAARGGPAATGDTWHIATEHRYSIDHIHPREYPSPAVGWRSAGTTSEVIAWKITDETTGGKESDLWALYIDQTNIPQLKVYVSSVTTPTWVDASGGVPLYTEFSGTRSGSVVQPINTGAAVPGPYIERDELVGGSVRVSSGDVRRIIRNDAGYLTSGNTIQNRVRIYLNESDVDATDGTSGTFQLRFPRVLVVLNSQWAATEGPIVAIKIEINASGQDVAPEGYWTAGIVALGPVSAFGWDYSATRRVSTAYNVDLTETAGGRRASRVAGPQRRTVEFAWTEGVDVGVTWATQDDYLLPAAAREPIATRRDAPRLLSGLLSEIDGPHTPVVYLPSIAGGTAATSVYKQGRAGGVIYGRIVGDLSLETQLGDENETELVRVAEIRIEEEV